MKSLLNKILQALMSLIPWYNLMQKTAAAPPVEEPEGPVQLAAPTNFTAVADGEAAVLSWTPNPAGGNQVLEKEENGARGLLVELSSNTATYRREQQGFGTTCTYYLKCKGNGVSTLDSPYVSTSLAIADGYSKLYPDTMLYPDTQLYT